MSYLRRILWSIAWDSHAETVALLPLVSGWLHEVFLVLSNLGKIVLNFYLLVKLGNNKRTINVLRS